MSRCSSAPPWARALACLICALCLQAAADDGREPRPGTLADYAGRVRLNRSAVPVRSGPLVLDDVSVAELARLGTLTLGTVDLGPLPPAAAADAAERATWRSRYRAQQRAIDGLERRRAQVAAERDLLRRSRSTAAVVARIERAEVELCALDDGLRSARSELARIVRDARARGAEPGWFR